MESEYGPERNGALQRGGEGNCGSEQDLPDRSREERAEITCLLPRRGALPGYHIYYHCAGYCGRIARVPRGHRVTRAIYSETTCTVISLFRGRLSKSTSTICCQVPS